jgi:hypothetical protein
MPGWLKGLLTVVLWAVVPPMVVGAVLGATNNMKGFEWVVFAAIFGLLYGLEAGILTAYDLGSPKGRLELVVDMTWSLPNTVWGFALGNLIFWFFGNPSRTDSADAGWVVFQPRAAGGFGHNVLQTHGTLNLGGAGQHEKLHLLQARIFGPLSVVSGFFGWIYYATLFELWAYNAGNP